MKLPDVLISCDNCSKKKEESFVENNWFRLEVNKDNLVATKQGYLQRFFHFCSKTCLQEYAKYLK